MQRSREKEGAGGADITEVAVFQNGNGEDKSKCRR